jgi:acyl-coenzyme A thioesterase PaaI-like protein
VSDGSNVPAPNGTEHPMLAGRGDSPAALADAVRRLIGLCTATTAPQEVTLAAARRIEAIADELARHVPDPLPSSSALRPDGEAADLAERLPFDVVIGRQNPLAPPLTVRFEPPRAVLTGVFGRAYEGPPGCVHGAVIAAAFDMVLAAGSLAGGAIGPTARLEITYRRPTALNVPCEFEGRVEWRDRRNVRAAGQLTQRGRVTVEATGDFVLVGHEQMARMGDRAAGRA